MLNLEHLEYYDNLFQSLSPGLVRTEFGGLGSSPDFLELIKDKPILNAEDIANTALFLLGTPPHVQVCTMYIYL